MSRRDGPIASDFIGLSYEFAILAAGDYFMPDNGPVLGLIRSLGENGVIRIGGNTSERTVWRSQAKPVGSGSFVMTPAGIDRLAAAMRILGWKLIYGLNLARGTPEEAAEEAAYVPHVVGSNLLAFQIGNEPDGFGRWTAVRLAARWSRRASHRTAATSRPLRFAGRREPCGSA
jgi:hypothetical protein